MWHGIFLICFVLVWGSGNRLRLYSCSCASLMDESRCSLKYRLQRYLLQRTIHIAVRLVIGVGSDLVANLMTVFDFDKRGSDRLMVRWTDVGSLPAGGLGDFAADTVDLALGMFAFLSRTGPCHWD